MGTTTTTASVPLITINPIDNIVSVRGRIVRTDDANDELSNPRPVEVNHDFKAADLAAVNVTIGGQSYTGDQVMRAAAKVAKKLLRKHYNGKVGAIATAITGIDENA